MDYKKGFEKNLSRYWGLFIVFMVKIKFKDV